MNAHSTLPIDRRAERTHLFLVATLAFGRGSTPVRVRNLSAGGALVESVDVPPTGTQIVLRRAALEAHGSVIWAGAGKAGLAFHEPLAVHGWLPAKAGQQRPPLDLGVTPEMACAIPSASDDARRALQPASLIAELSLLRDQIGHLGVQFASDADLVSRHPDLRLLAAAEQRLARLVATLLAG